MPEPMWLRIARLEKGIKETEGPDSTGRILEYLKTVDLSALGTLTDEVPWCSAFANWVMQQAGIEGTGLASARSWAAWGEMLLEPAIGAVVVLRRGSQNWQGHVGFVTGVHGQFIQVLGGNQGNAVSEQFFPRAKVVSYRWPRGVQRHDAAH